MKINEKEYKLSYTGLTLLIYKEEFNADLLTECQEMFNSKQPDIINVLKICWAMAKSNDESMPNFRQFMASIDIRDILKGGLLEEMIATVNRDRKTTKSVKKK